MTRRILVLAANPKDTSRLRLDEEVREIDNGLQRAQNRDEFVLKQQWAARPKDVRRAMLDFKPSIVHFCGHGEGTKGIAFEDETGNTKLVSAEALAGFFELFADRVECVVLNACYSEVQAKAISQHIDYVIGMKAGIGDTDAIEFAVAFYDALGAGESIGFAYKLACNAIRWAGIPGHLTPILKTKMDCATRKGIRNISIDRLVSEDTNTSSERLKESMGDVSLATPDAIGKYKLISVLGEDEVGVFYLARHIVLDMIVVVKWIHSHLADDSLIKRLFVDDARLSANLNHKGIIRVLDCGEELGRQYIVTEYVDGETLGYRIETEGCLYVFQALEIVQALARTLQIMFTKLHKTNPGIRPSNIRLTHDGQVKIGRVDPVKTIKADILTASYGKPSDRVRDNVLWYTAPEKLINWKYRSSCSTDIFSLGALLCYMLTGSHPFKADDPIIMLMNIQDPFTIVEPLISEFPAKLRTLISKMLAKNPHDRYQDYEELNAEIESIKSTEHIA